MRRLALAAAAALAACSVKLEGAPCLTDANCPDSQRCEGAGAGPGRCVGCVADPACAADGTYCVSGDDTLLRLCSTNAGSCRYSTVTACSAPQTCQGTAGTASCACPTSGSSLGQGCGTSGALACDAGSGNAIACSSLGACLVWTAAPGTSCTSQGLVCDASGGAPVCVCNAYTGSVFYADPVSGSAASDAVKPTGAQMPAICRFKRLGDALARPAALAAATPATVRMTGWTSAPVVFSSALSGETFPLAVAPGVTLATTDSPPVPGNYVIQVDQAATGPALKLDHDTAASGFTVQPATGGSAADALLVSCTAAGSSPVLLSDLVLDGKGQLGASAIGVGLLLTGPCSATVSRVTAENASGAGVRVETSFPMGGPAPAVSVASSTMRRNGDGGLVVNVDASNGKPALTIAANDVTLNDAATTYTDTSVVPNVSRKAGGVVLLAAAPAMAFTGNKVHGNSYDQVLVWSSDPAWTLSGSACDASSNVYACYDAVTSGGPWVGLSVLGGATVDALHDSWADAVPQSGRDYYKTSASTVNTNPACVASTLTCP